MQALRNISFAVGRGEIHGLCGHNGAGKSTLVRIFVGLTKPDTGTIVIEGEEITLRDPQQAQAHGIALVDQELSVVPVLTVQDNLFLGGIHVPFFHRRPSMRRQARELLDRIGLQHVRLSDRVESLAIGERQLLEIARLLGRNARLVILDEPTATLSEPEIERVFRAVREVAAQGKSVIYVSHRLNEVLSLCDRVSIFRDGERVATHAVGDLDRRLLITLMLGEMERDEVVELPPAIHERSNVGDTTLEVRDLTVRRRVRDFDLTARAGQVIGLAGQVGSGTSDVLRALGGLQPGASGHVSVRGHRLRLGSPKRALHAGVLYVSNDRQREGLFLRQSVEDNLVATRLMVVSRVGVVVRARLSRIAAYLAGLVGIDARRLRAPVGELSGGNQQKVLLGRCLERAQTQVLLLDEPTRGVDVGGRAEIHQLIRHAAAGGNAVLFASTELDEILELSDLVLTMFAGSVVSQRERGTATAAEIFGDMTMSKGPEAALELPPA